MDRDAIAYHIRKLMEEGFGINFSQDPDLVDTPDRAARYWMELLEGMQYTNDDIVEMFKDKLYTQYPTTTVCVKDIPIFSHCEHHLALMYDMTVDIKYQSYGKVIGLSKINRICELVGKRLQLQERIATDIKYILSELLGVYVEVVVRGKHACVTARGIKSNSVTVTEA